MNFKEIYTWIKGLIITDKVEALGFKIKPKTGQPQIRDLNNPDKNKIYLNDPSTPQFIIEEQEPADTLFAMRAMGEAGGGYPLGSIQQQALAVKQMVNSALIYMVGKTSKSITNWAATNSLTIIPRAGKDINAFYDRNALQFFYFGDPVLKKNVYAADARSVVTHEFGHAFLDILRPDWWDTQSSEIWAFHEAFGDMTALLAALEHDTLIDEVIRETNGNLMKSNIISRLAAEMGIGLYHVVETQQSGAGYNPTCLRDLTISFNYVKPETLPTDGPDSVIINECHSFSRVFSHAFYEILVNIAQFNISEHQNLSLKEALKLARDTMATSLIDAVLAAPTTARIYDAVAKNMIANSQKYHQIMSSIFMQHNIIDIQVKMLDAVDIKTFVKDIKEPHEIRTKGNTKIVRTLGTKTIKLTDKLGVMALSENPLLDLEITVPNQSSYYFENDMLVDSSECDEAEVLDVAYTCLDMLHKKNLVGDHQAAIFDVKYGKLVRKQIICTCGRPNYCDSNAPEFGKPWKPRNNSGCSVCHANCEPRSCSCESLTQAPAPKLGCFTTIRNGGNVFYKSGSNASRKFC